MPTKPLESILYRDLSKVAAKHKIDVASPLLVELVNFGTNALVRCSDSAKGGRDEDVAPLSLYRHLLEMTDGIQVLLEESCPTPAIPALRSAFEAFLSIEYILEDDSEYVNRSLAWLVGYVHQRLKSYQRLDPATNRGTAFQRLANKDSVASDIKMPTVKDAKRAAANLQDYLKKPHVRHIESEYNRLRRPRWHQLFDGPPNLQALAERLNRGAQYEILYRQWSRTTHSQDLQAFLDKTNEGEAAIARLRNPDKIGQVATFAANFALGGTRMIVRKFRPGEDLSRWYKREVQERFLIVTGVST